MHDFAVISLSDLLTPWELIEKRLRAAAEAASSSASATREPRTARPPARGGDTDGKAAAGPPPAGCATRAATGELRPDDARRLKEAPIDMFCTVIIRIPPPRDRRTPDNAARLQRPRRRRGLK
ncbi:MAG: hypothetical protein ACLUEQ_01820 [Cloacibacillus evryensis]